jgi:hypothetical protein
VVKKYTFEVTEDEEGLHITRNNNGFTIHELLTFTDDLKMDLMNIWKDIMHGCIEKRVTFDNGKKKGEIDKIPPGNKN